MSDHQTPPAEYTALLAWDPTTANPGDALQRLGMLIDAATERGDPEGLRRAITIAPGIRERLSKPANQARLFYFVGNAWSELQRRRPAATERIWEWEQPECEQAILAYRTAINTHGFNALKPVEQSRLLTNLANLLDHLGRTIEAIRYWDRALQITPGFGMARANRALGLTSYARHLYDNGHKGVFYKTAHAEFTTALTENLESHAITGITAARDHITELLTPEYLANPLHLDDYPLGSTTEEQEYRRRLLNARLFLNPLNDLGPHPIAARDILSTPPIVVKAGSGPTYQGFMNQLKQEFVGARYLYDQGTHDRTPHYADRGVLLTDTMDYPSYGLRTEYLRTSFRLAYSLLDKTAYFLNDYLGLNIPETQVSFRGLWYTKNKANLGLRPEFTSRENLPLRALYWLAKDLAPTEEVAGTLEPDAQALASIRNHLEHKYCKLHIEGFLSPEPSRASGMLADTMALSMNRLTFEKKCRHLLRLARASIIYLALAIHREEQERATTRPPTDRIASIRLDRLPDADTR
ncbi:MAG: LA2681 family HEPN domain-containing protein [Thermoanaerobaculia bacterium]